MLFSQLQDPPPSYEEVLSGENIGWHVNDGSFWRGNRTYSVIFNCTPAPWLDHACPNFRCGLAELPLEAKIITFQGCILYIHVYLIYPCLNHGLPLLVKVAPASPLFTQLFIQTHIKQNIKALRHWSLCREFIGENVFPATDFQRNPLVSDPGMHHGTCVTYVPCCMSGSLTRGGGENVPTGEFPAQRPMTRNFTYLARGPWRSVMCQCTTSWYHVWFVNNEVGPRKESKF